MEMKTFRADQESLGQLEALKQQLGMNQSQTIRWAIKTAAPIALQASQELQEMEAA